MKSCRTIGVLAVLLSVSVSMAGGPDTCLRFLAPAQKSIITVPSCTLGVEALCKKIKKTEIAVRYFPERSDTAVVTTIGVINRPPFKQIWNLHTIPNQLFIGVGIVIEATLYTGEVSRMHREGIFLAHQPVRNPLQRSLRYEIPGAEFPRDTLYFPASSSSSLSAFAQAFWNEKNVSIRVKVHDTAFRSAMSDSILRQMGIEILIDPTRKLRPYPSEDIMMFVVPLSGNPYRVTYTPVFNDSGNYRLTPLTTRSNVDYSIEPSDRSGFSVVLSIPHYFFGKSLSPEMGLNIIAKTADGRGAIVTSSWIGAEGYNNYSPFLWATIKIDPKPVFKTRWIVLLVFFLIGLGIPPCFYLVSVALKKERPRIVLTKRIHDVSRSFEKIKEAVERSITRRDISPHLIGTDCGIAPSLLEKVIKKATNLSFKSYVAYLRTEIVCERLRSSHSSEASIAETCGFRNVNEMEKYFQKFHRMTPFNYRKTQQINQTQ